MKIIAWAGRCEVHERFTAQDIIDIRAAYPNAEILAHPECPTEVIEQSDFTGSTAAFTDYIVKRKPKQVVLITECSMADNVACDAPETEFVRPCNLCPHMKRISLEAIHDALMFNSVRGDGRRGGDRAGAAGRAADDRPAAAEEPGPLRPGQGAPPRRRGTHLTGSRRESATMQTRTATSP